MIKTKRLVALSIGLIMTASLFTGCSTDGLVLMNAFGKSQEITSMQSQTDISVKVSGSKMSEQEQQMMSTMLPMINGANISVSTKINQNKEKTIGKMQSDISLKSDQLPEPISMSVWADTDMSGDVPVVNEVVKMPQLMTAQFPKKLQGKEYMVMNLSDMTSAPGMVQPNYKKLISFSKEFQPKFLDFIAKYSKQFNPTTDYIKNVASQNFLEDNIMKSADVYQVKLTDKSFKDLMHYTLNNLAGNADAMTFVKDYMLAISSIYDVTDAKNKTNKDEINKAFDNLTTELPQQLATLNKALDAIEGIKILGDNGITINYTVNDDGYVIKEKGNAEFVVDLPSIIKLAGNTSVPSTSSDPTGVYTIGVSFNTDMTNINGDVKVVFPKVDSTNSFNFTDVMKLASEELPTK
ncbi:hypothetical protein K9O30_01300 [Clostridium bowmanii]|uniref:hypothetical protein n=1 Tax=Clostridium bowmanii TaxID=132925 RepID=UPI001C0CBA6B|nr:hypothetical protein [Clostridium bowmanii]MBU3191553.1 hypothetical protein [Clostridium bowmanii]MCA1072394.1 hypothetical protein [Clostridium bowmanii]